MNLKDLVQRAQKEDRLAQRELYYLYKDSLYTLVLRILTDKASAQDVLQETFIDAFRGLRNLTEPDYFYSWIRKIAVRKTYKMNKAEQKIQVIDDIEKAHLEAEPAPQLDYIETAIAALPARSRIVFMMIEVEGFSHKEVSEALEISVGTSKSQLHYAKSKLKEQLQKHYS